MYTYMYTHNLCGGRKLELWNQVGPLPSGRVDKELTHPFAYIYIYIYIYTYMYICIHLYNAYIYT